MKSLTSEERKKIHEADDMINMMVYLKKRLDIEYERKAQGLIYMEQSTGALDKYVSDYKSAKATIDNYELRRKAGLPIPPEEAYQLCSKAEMRMRKRRITNLRKRIKSLTDYEHVTRGRIEMIEDIIEDLYGEPKITGTIR